MMTNLFSLFDPSSNIMNLSINWLLLIPTSLWLITSRKTILWNLIINKLQKNLSYLLEKSKMMKDQPSCSLQCSIIPLHFYKNKTHSNNIISCLTIMIKFYTLWLN